MGARHLQVGAAHQKQRSRLGWRGRGSGQTERTHPGAQQLGLPEVGFRGLAVEEGALQAVTHRPVKACHPLLTVRVVELGLGDCGCLLSAVLCPGNTQSLSLCLWPAQSGSSRQSMQEALAAIGQLSPTATTSQAREAPPPSHP